MTTLAIPRRTTVRRQLDGELEKQPWAARRLRPRPNGSAVRAPVRPVQGDRTGLLAVYVGQPSRRGDCFEIEFHAT